MNRCRDTTLDILMISNGTALSEHVVSIVAVVVVVAAAAAVVFLSTLR